MSEWGIGGHTAVASLCCTGSNQEIVPTGIPQADSYTLIGVMEIDK